MEKYKIKNLGTIISGGTPSTSNENYWDGNIIWITPKDLSKNKCKYIYTGERNISKDGLEHSSAKLLPKNAVLLSSRAPIGYLALAGCELTTNQGFKSIVCNESIILSEYLYYLLSTKIDDLISISSGSTFLELSKSAFENLELNIHNINEQQHIVDTIGSIDDLIDTNNKIIESLSAYCDKLFKKIDYIDFKSYELGELFDIKIGRTPPRAEKEWFNCEPSIKWISISDMCDKFKFIFKTKECLTIRAVSKFNVPIIPKDTLIMSFKLTVGRLGITTEDMLSNEAIAAFNTDNLVLRNYVLFYLSNFDFKSLGNTSSIANAINSKIIKTISIKVPSEIELTYFNDKASLLLDKILNISKQNNTLIKLKEMYLKKFFG